jgi:hypothetical protein
MGFRKTWVAGALLLCGCVPRSEGIATAAWADDGNSFLAVQLSYLPSHGMFGSGEQRSDVRARFFEQVPGRTERVQVGPDVSTDVMGPSYYVKSAGFFVYFAGAPDSAVAYMGEKGSWVERAVPGGEETVVAAPADRPAGCHETQVVPSRDGKHLAVLHTRCDLDIECELDIQARDTRTTAFTHRWMCQGWSVSWQPNGELWIDGQLSDSSLHVVGPAWAVAPPQASATSLCALPTGCGGMDDRGRMLQYSPFDTAVTVLQTEQPAGCVP